MKKYLLLLLLLAVQIVAAAPGPIVADRGKSVYKIVYADSDRSPEVNELVKKAPQPFSKSLNCPPGQLFQLYRKNPSKKILPRFMSAKFPL